MRLFICLLLQFFIFLPLTSLASDLGTNPVIKSSKTTELTETQKAGLINSYGKLPLSFIENKGQVDGKVSFYERGAGQTTFFTSEGVVLSLTKRKGEIEKNSRHAGLKDLESQKDKKAVTEAVSLSFAGANKDAKIVAGDKKTGHVNYFIGNDRSKWRTNIPTYGAVTYKDVYKKIDVKFYGTGRQLEHDVIVRPGGSIADVKFAYTGIKGLKVTKDGGLDVILKNGKIREQRPVIYQEIKGEKVAVKGSYKLIGKNDDTFSYGFDVASYDQSKKIVIDPVLIHSTYLGGTSVDFGADIAIDASGSAYVTGYTSSLDFPLIGPIQGASGGSIDAFITKVNPAGTAYVYSTYLGGANFDFGTGIAVDTSGSAYVTGETTSTDFPIMNPMQGVFGGGSADAFISKIGMVTQPPVVTITLVPDTATVAQGFSLGYTVTATNTTAVQQCFNYWENVNLPGGALFPAQDSLLKPVPQLCLNAGASQTVHLTHGIPFTAPTGAYVFNSYVGIFPFNFRAVVDTAHFNFDVTAGVAPIANPQTSWRVLENGFRK